MQHPFQCQPELCQRVLANLPKKSHYCPVLGETLLDAFHGFRVETMRADGWVSSGGTRFAQPFPTEPRLNNRAIDRDGTYD
jgi:hypothetical protein